MPCEGGTWTRRASVCDRPPRRPHARALAPRDASRRPRAAFGGAPRHAEPQSAPSARSAEAASPIPVPHDAHEGTARLAASAAAAASARARAAPPSASDASAASCSIGPPARFPASPRTLFPPRTLLPPRARSGRSKSRRRHARLQRRLQASSVDGSRARLSSSPAATPAATSGVDERLRVDPHHEPQTARQRRRRVDRRGALPRVDRRGRSPRPESPLYPPRPFSAPSFPSFCASAVPASPLRLPTVGLHRLRDALRHQRRGQSQASGCLARHRRNASRVARASRPWPVISGYAVRPPGPAPTGPRPAGAATRSTPRRARARRRQRRHPVASAAKVQVARLGQRALRGERRLGAGNVGGGGALERRLGRSDVDDGGFAATGQLPRPPPTEARSGCGTRARTEAACRPPARALRGARWPAAARWPRPGGRRGRGGAATRAEAPSPEQRDPCRRDTRGARRPAAPATMLRGRRRGRPSRARRTGLRRGFVAGARGSGVVGGSVGVRVGVGGFVVAVAVVAVAADGSDVGAHRHDRQPPSRLHARGEAGLSARREGHASNLRIVASERRRRRRRRCRRGFGAETKTASQQRLPPVARLEERPNLALQLHLVVPTQVGARGLGRALAALIVLALAAPWPFRTVYLCIARCRPSMGRPRPSKTQPAKSPRSEGGPPTAAAAAAARR